MNAMAAQAALDMQRVNDEWAVGSVDETAREMYRASRNAECERIMSECVNAISAAYGIAPEDILGRSQDQHISHPRQDVMHLARLQNMSFQEIGRHLGGRDHNTVIYGVKASQARLDKAKESK